MATTAALTLVALAFLGSRSAEAAAFSSADDMKTRMEAAVTAQAYALSGMYASTVESAFEDMDAAGHAAACPHLLMCDRDEPAWETATRQPQFLNPDTSSCTNIDLDGFGGPLDEPVTGRDGAWLSNPECVTQCAHEFDRPPLLARTKATCLDDHKCTIDTYDTKCLVADADEHYGVALPDSDKRNERSGEVLDLQMSNEIRAEICATNKLLPSIKQNAADMPETGWSFLGLQASGLYRTWPSTYQCRTEHQCSGCSDPRFRGWYASVASGPKEVVIVLDTYGPDLYSENDYNLADAKVAAGWALNTLTDSDFFSIVTYDKRGTTLWRRELIRATPPNLAAAKRWLERVEAGYGARLDRAVSDAMELFSGAGPSGCTGARTILLLTSGSNHGKRAESPSEIVRAMQSLTNPVRFFVYSFGGEGSKKKNMIRNLACENDGVYFKIKQPWRTKEVMAGYFSYLAAALAPPVADEAGTYTRWLQPYEDGQGRGIMTGVCAPAWNYEVDPPGLFGVVCLGVPLPVAESLSGWETTRDQMQEERRACANPKFTDGQLDALRARAEYGMSCESSGAATAAAGAAILAICFVMAW